MSRVLLINPPFSRLRGTKDVTEIQPPMGLACLAACLKTEGFEPVIYDCNYNPAERLPTFNDLKKQFKQYARYSENIHAEEHSVWSECRRTVTAIKPDVVGISVLSPVLGSALRVARICKEVSPGTKVVFGGYHPSADPQGVLRSGNVDVAVRGEGEVTFTELVGRISRNEALNSLEGVSYKENGTVHDNPERPLIEDLDSLPFPVDFMWADVTGKASIQYSRGCPFGCKFCSDSSMWKRKVRYRSAENFVSEIETVISRFGVRYFDFIDGTFNTSRTKVIEVCELLLKRKLRILWNALVRADTLDDELLRLWRRAGCVQLNIGIESGSQRVIDAVKKGIDLKETEEKIKLIRKHGIVAVSFFCIGMPPETAEDMEATYDFIGRLPHDYVILFAYTPLPGSEFYEELKEGGFVSGDHDFDAYGYRALRNNFAVRMKKEEFTYWRDRIVTLTNRKNSRFKFGMKLFMNNTGFYLRFPGLLWKRVLRFIGY